MVIKQYIHTFAMMENWLKKHFLQNKEKHKNTTYAYRNVSKNIGKKVGFAKESGFA